MLNGEMHSSNTVPAGLYVHVDAVPTPCASGFTKPRRVWLMFTTPVFTIPGYHHAPATHVNGHQPWNKHIT